MRRHVLLPALLAACLASHISAVLAIEAECSACEAVATELQRRLDAEVNRKHLDLRHRLDKDGVRYGRILDYKLSEIRAVELLDDLCSTMDAYTFVTGSPAVSDVTDDVADDGAGDANAGSDGEGGGAADEAAAGEDSEGQKPQKRKSSKQVKRKKGAPKQPEESSSENGSGGSGSSGGSEEPAWVKHKGEGKTHVPRSKRPSQEEEDARQKQLKSYCGLLLEEREDEVVEALTSDQFSAAGVAPVLCQRVSAACKHKTYAAPAPQAASQGGDGDREL